MKASFTTAKTVDSISKMNHLRKESVMFVTIGHESEGQRIDNFLLHRLKGVPKSHVYRLLRTGQVRVNKGRADATRKLCLGDEVRLPPVRQAATITPPTITVAREKSLLSHILYQDDAIIILDKPAGMAVHGGSGVSFGVIEQLRAELPDCHFLELAHRLDRETSGALILARRRSALVKLHDMFRGGQIRKRYLTLVHGHWQHPVQHVTFALHKYLDNAGERRVKVAAEGKPAHTIFRLQQHWPEFSLLEAELKTGRTHQIRVHLAHSGFPIAGDDKYGDFSLNRTLIKQGLKRMFLHARQLDLRHPLSDEILSISAPLPDTLQTFIGELNHANKKQHEE